MHTASPFPSFMTTALTFAQFPEEMETLLWLAALWGGVWVLRPLATFLHELGHALPALVFTKGEVKVRVGDSFEKSLLRIGRLGCAFALRRSSIGFTSYDRASLGKGALVIVILGGPLASGLACGLGSWAILLVTEQTWTRIVAAAFLCANGILFLRSAIPVTLKPTKQFPEGPPSDGLDLWRTLRGKVKGN